MTFRVFAAAVALALLHAFDDAFLLPGGGVPLTQHALAFGIALAATGARDLALPLAAAGRAERRSRSASARSPWSTAGVMRTTS